MSENTQVSNPVVIGGAREWDFVREDDTFYINIRSVYSGHPGEASSVKRSVHKMTSTEYRRFIVAAMSVYFGEEILPHEGLERLADGCRCEEAVSCDDRAEESSENSIDPDWRFKELVKEALREKEYEERGSNRPSNGLTFIFNGFSGGR